MSEENGDEDFKRFMRGDDDDDDDDYCHCSISKDELILKTIESKTGTALKMLGLCLEGYTQENADDELKDALLTKIDAATTLIMESTKTYDYLLSKMIDEAESND